MQPGATGPTAHRFCTAYTFAKAHGTAAQRAAARHNLISAAGGAGKVAAFCGAAAHPGKSGARGKGASHGNHGKSGSNGNQGQEGPAGHRNGHHVPNSKGKSSAHGGGNRGKHGAPHASGQSAQTPARHRAVTSRSSLGRAGPRHRPEG